MNPTPPTTSVLDEVATWPGVSTQPTPRGATAIVFEATSSATSNSRTMQTQRTASRCCAKATTNYTPGELSPRSDALTGRSRISAPMSRASISTPTCHWPA